MIRTVGIRLFCKCEPSVLFCNASGFIISAYKSCRRPLSYCGLHALAVSVFGKKIRCGLRFFGVFLCGFAVFGPSLRPPSHANGCRNRDLGGWASQTSHLNTSKFLPKNWGVARRDLGNRLKKLRSGEAKSLNKVSNLMTSQLFYAHILDINKSSLHTRSFRSIHIFVFTYRLTEKWLWGPKEFPAGLSRNGSHGPRSR